MHELQCIASCMVIDHDAQHYVYICKIIAASVLCEIKQNVHSQNANKAQGKAECFISIEAMR